MLAKQEKSGKRQLEDIQDLHDSGVFLSLSILLLARLSAPYLFVSVTDNAPLFEK